MAMNDKSAQMTYVESIDLGELFEELSTQDMSNALKEYSDSLDAFFRLAPAGSYTSSVRGYENFDVTSLNQDDSTFVSNALRLANYDENALRGENIVLFHEPVILSEFMCSANIFNANEGVLRLISYLGTDKKVTTKWGTSVDETTKKPVTTYSVHDLVIGLILPQRCKFTAVKFAEIDSLVTDYKKLKRVRDSLEKARELPLIQRQNLQSKFQDINSLIKIKSDEFTALESDIEVLEHQKSHTETNLSRSQNALQSVQEDIAKATKEYESLLAQHIRETKQLSSVKEEIKQNSDLLKKEAGKLRSLKEENSDQSASLLAIKAELADAKREKNLTTFDTIGHSKETWRQLKGYYVLAILLLSGLAIMAEYIYSNGQKISSLLPYLVHVSSWDILLSRLPLVAATTLIIGGLTGALFYLIKHIVLLNTEKMVMLKAGILAEQITNSLDCKNMGEQEILEFKRDTKIKLIMEVFNKNEPDVKQSNMVLEVLKAVNANKG
ncbi:hypothetical protein ACRTD6_07800 [Vibrio parahaemolyticus]|uniref:hypothetical protein n=1 Tax=Vibrio parahaemolyticus TaxID=670 RepID=UPI00193CFBB5|nr:hypothetical protein [Vibrio parahaemolyticus]HAS6978159.1 hypothetical protein [Vibrio parahaemolyticus]HCG7375463.1 hypothetical protein [Vibrio parahaemolyticus]